MKKVKKYGIPRPTVRPPTPAMPDYLLKAPEYILIDGPAYCKYRLPCGMCERTGKDCNRNNTVSDDKETADKQIIAPVGTVKSVRIIEDDGSRRLIPLDKVIIERYEDGQI